MTYVAGQRVRSIEHGEACRVIETEAGLVMREVLLHGMVRRTLVVAPKELASQWIAVFRRTVRCLVPDGPIRVGRDDVRLGGRRRAPR